MEENFPNLNIIDLLAVKAKEPNSNQLSAAGLYYISLSNHLFYFIFWLFIIDFSTAKNMPCP